MGRFKKERTNYRKSLILKNAGVYTLDDVRDIFEEDEEIKPTDETHSSEDHGTQEPKTPENTVSTRESTFFYSQARRSVSGNSLPFISPLRKRCYSGSITKRKSAGIVTKLNAKMTLIKNRYMLFSSKEFVHTKNRVVPVSKDPSVNSTVGFLRSTLDPSYRDSAIGDYWIYSDGISKDEINDELYKDAEYMYKREKKLGEFSIPPSPLRNAHSTAQESTVRRSERLKKKLIL
jgi:hypothetical protein